MKKFIYLIFCLIPLYSFSQWQEVEVGIPVSDNINSISRFDNVLFAMTSSSQLYWSFDNGDTWQYRSSENGILTYKNVLVRGFENNTLMISSDSGLTYFAANHIKVQKKFSNNSAQFPLIEFADTAVFLSDSSYWVSYDNCITWQEYFFPTVCFDGYMFKGNNSIFFRIKSQYITWPVYAYKLFKMQSIGNLTLMDMQSFECSLSMCVGNNILHWSGNSIVYQDSNYSIQPSGLSNATGNRCFNQFEDYIFISIDTNFLISNDATEHGIWHLFNAGFKNNHGVITQIFVYNNYLFAVTQNGIYRVELSSLTNTPIGVKNNAVNVFPNPASTTINIEIEEQKQSIQLDLLNLQGKIQMQTIISESKVLDVSHLPRGLYVLKLSGKDLNLSRKVVLIE